MDEDWWIDIVDSQSYVEMMDEDWWIDMVDSQSDVENLA